MVGNRRSPVPAPPSLPPSSKAKDYSNNERPTEVMDELDEIRTRGIAKILNRHFTDTTKQLAKEKAAADASLADLERRRANTSTFVPSKGGELNPFDSLYVEMQQKRAECRRREKETMLLYQRYVQRYGKAARKVSPKQLLESSPKSSPKNTIDTLPPSSPIPSKGTPLQPLEEDEPAAGEETVFSDFSIKKSNNNSPGEDPPELSAVLKLPSTPIRTDVSLPDLAALTPATSKDTVVSMPQEDPPEYMETMSQPGIASLDDLKCDSLSARPRGRGDDPPVEPTALNVESDDSNSSLKEKSIEDAGVASLQEPLSQSDPQDSVKQKSEEQSGAEEKTDANSSEVSDMNRPTKEVTAELPTTAASIEDAESDDRSVISGLTMNSATTRQVLEDIEVEMDQFLKTETEAIQKQLDQEEEHTMISSFHNSSQSLMGAESVRVTMKAEAMAKEMQHILDTYDKEDTSSAAMSGSDSEVVGGASATSTSYPRKFNTSNPEEEWFVYYDKNLNREYFYEQKTKKSQWDAPVSTEMKKAASRSILVDADDFIPEASVCSTPRRNSRKNVYRQKLRKRRKRRMVVLAFLSSIAMATYMLWQVRYPELRFSEAMQEASRSTKDAVVETGNWLVHKYEYTFTDREAREKEQWQEAEETRKRRLVAERKAKAEARAKEAEARRVEFERKATAEAKRKAETAKRSEMERAAARQRELSRPWACNLPLSYIIHPRCRKLSKISPFYDESLLSDSFMQ